MAHEDTFTKPNKDLVRPNVEHCIKLSDTKPVRIQPVKQTGSSSEKKLRIGREKA